MDLLAEVSKLMNQEKSQKERILDILRSAKAKDGIGWVSGMYLENLVPKITQRHTRVNELKKQGYEIEGAYINPDQNWKYYRLVSEPQKLPPAFNPKPPEEPIRQVSLPSI